MSRDVVEFWGEQRGDYVYIELRTKGQHNLRKFYLPKAMWVVLSEQIGEVEL